MLFLLSCLISWLVKFIVSLFLSLVISVPIFIILFIRMLFTWKPIFRRHIIYGKAAEPIVICFFNLKGRYLRGASLFIHVLSGKLSLVGVGIRDYTKAKCVAGDAYLFRNSPGIFNLWFIKESSKIAHHNRHEVEWEYIFRKRLVSDMMLILKSIPAAFYRVEATEYTHTVNLFDIEFMNVTMANAVEMVENAIQNNAKRKVFFVNPDCLNKLFTEEKYYDNLKHADWIFPDGIGINIACKIIRSPLRENVNGTDMLPFLCELAETSGFSFYLLGGKPGIAAKMKTNLEKKYPQIIIKGEHDGFFQWNSTDETAIIDQINELRPDILLVAFGVPKQEEWITANAERLNCKVMIGVGGLFDFYSGNIRRAPVWMREVGMEWFYRFMQEPKRMWKRYFLGNPLFIYRVLKWKINRVQRKSK